jgi:sugar transferase EpsL
MLVMSFGKRLFDVIFTLVALILLSPFLLLIALLVRIFIGAPVLFTQTRPGYQGRPFHIYKFRTMTNRLAPDGNLLPDAERITPLGLFLRSLSLDELPELFNILKGEMSIVGPRPLLMEYLPRYSPEQMRRHNVRPGLTGWAQVNGRNTITWADKFTYDVWYVDHGSFWLDLKIIALTAWKVLTREGVSQDGHATREPFMGNNDNSAGA